MKCFKPDPQQIQVIREVATDCTMSLLKAATNREGLISNYSLVYALMVMIETIVSAAEANGDKGKTRSLLKEVISKYFNEYHKPSRRKQNLKPN